MTLAPASRATRLAFLVGGFLPSAWAPLIPFAKERVGADEGLLGLLLLCLGIGSVIAMPLTGTIAARTGPRPVILIGGAGLVLATPFLMIAAGPLALGAALFVFGASLGSLDVAMNVHAVEVERRDTRPLMSGFHAMFSVGGILGAGGATLMLTLGAGPIATALTAAVLAALALAVAAPGLLRAGGEEPPPLALPRGIVLLFAGLAAVCFLAEGAVLDWGALLLTGLDRLDAAQAGLGYMAFSVTMTAGRLTGDRIVAALGRFHVLFWGGLIASAGIVLAVMLPGAAALAGFALIGVGAANLVPVVFSLTGKQTLMPPALAIAAVTTTGYAGVLLGPALIGFLADWTSLPLAFGMLAVLMLAFPLTARRAWKA
ncbi:MFS transporter [Pseudoroseicyclus sp. CXY001]|uniref:MFS transporter n=1 Tax=Pseudoroseicyclus sp. CXY001 TaxID=3242492 RepID=UPI00357105A0